MNATNGTASHNGDASTFLNIVAPKFDPLAAMHLWQQSAARFSRANEQLMRGLTAAAQMQVELGQKLMHRQFSSVKNLSTGANPVSVLNGQIAKSSEETENLVISLRKISDEIRLGFTQATRILFEEKAPDAHESLAADAGKTDFNGARKAANTVEARA
jgi:hypothetical protein